ncbi:MAG: FKBP-type peptidyl-prolyl cis-trans isomerase SlyD [Haloarculaceae archaeon]
MLKSATGDEHGMSNDSEATEADDESVDETEQTPDSESEQATQAETEPEAGADDGEDSEDVEGLQDGDFIEFDYTARTVEDGDLVDTTDEEVAEEADVEADQEFGPRTIVLGEDHVFPSVEEDIVGKEIGDSGSVVVPAEEAFGDYDDEEVRTVSKDKIPEDDRYPGAQVTVDGEQGYVETIIGGRARVDFNHPLAGEDIEYEYEVVGEIEDRQARAEGLLELLLDLQLEVHFETDTVEEEQLVEPDEDETEDAETDDEADADEGDEDEEDDEPPEPEFETVEVEKESLYIEATPQLTMNQQWMMQKQQIAQQLMGLLDVDRVVIQEIIDGSGGMGMPGMMGGMGGMGGGGGEDLEAALEEADIDADELSEELDQ